MKLAVLICSILFLISCSSTPLSGKVDLSNKRYTSPDEEFEIDLPNIPTPLVMDNASSSKVTAEFVIDPGYWTPYGLHSIELLKNKKTLSLAEFKDSIKAIFYRHLKDRFSVDGDFSLVEQATGEDNESYVFLASGVYKGIPSSWICTIKWHTDGIAFVSKIIPKNNHRPINKIGQNTQSYMSWVSSLRIK